MGASDPGNLIELAQLVAVPPPANDWPTAWYWSWSPPIPGG